MTTQLCLKNPNSSPVKNWISVGKHLEIRRKNIPYYGDLYAYAANNPVRYVDPDGREVFTTGAAIIWGLNTFLAVYGHQKCNSQSKGERLYRQIETEGSMRYSFGSLYCLYSTGQGKDVTLSQLGLSATIRTAVSNNPDIRKQDKSGVKTVQDAFITNDLIGRGKKFFNNSYDFGSLNFEIGNATVGGYFDGNVTKNNDGTYHVKGVIHYYFLDIFQDPYDLGKLGFSESGKIANIDGKPYKIKDIWDAYIDGDYK